MLEYHFYCADCGARNFRGDAMEEDAMVAIRGHIEDHGRHLIHVEILEAREDEMSPEPNHEPDDFSSNIDDAENY